MAKKKQQQNQLEMLDSLIPIALACWVLTFAFIAYFIGSNVLAMITVMPAFFVYSFYLIFSALFSYKEVEFLEALGKDPTDAIAKRRLNPPQLSQTKLIAAGISFIIGILLCIFL